MVVNIPSPTYEHYKIEHYRASDASLLMFIRHAVTNRHLVIKMLREYHDDRYDLTTVQVRHKCQIEALYWNKKFTPNVYLGLANVIHLDLEGEKKVIISEIIKRPELAALNENKDCVLVMRQLPKSRRLDQLLKESNETTLYNHIRLVVEHIAKLHKTLPPPPTFGDGNLQWGSIEQLQKKLQENLQFFKEILLGGRHEDQAMQDNLYSFLKERMEGVLKDPNFIDYFEQRFADGQIKRCHGDLKATNIWVTQYHDRRARKSTKNIKLIDAIDFNEKFCCIDKLSDFAMLVADIHARTKDVALIQTMISEYLEMTGQANAMNRLVLNYYIAEKTIINSVINVIYDEKPKLGLSFLDLISFYLENLSL